MTITAAKVGFRRSIGTCSDMASKHINETYYQKTLLSVHKASGTRSHIESHQWKSIILTSH